MRLTSFLTLLLVPLAASSTLPSPQHVFSNPEQGYHPDYKIPTVHESAVQARRILHLESLGTLSTVFPSSDASGIDGLEGAPIGLIDYYGDCEFDAGNPTILAISIATSFKNVRAGSNITLSLRWHPPTKRAYSAAAMPRFSLMGYLEPISNLDLIKSNIPTCFTGYHPDAVAWFPGNVIHESHWVRLVVEKVYWIGGFGDRAYIGWIPAEEWRNVTRKEVHDVRLPGEKKKGELKSWLEWLFLSADL
ncbi:MAG: hypothetical protein M1819_004159 [Sarea resinae]|nr:MAG: hypothetical protein M1819_004159 [Sarea resinae]